MPARRGAPPLRARTRPARRRAPGRGCRSGGTTPRGTGCPVEPVDRSSTTPAWCPAASSRDTRLLPMNPAPPVTRTRTTRLPRLPTAACADDFIGAVLGLRRLGPHSHQSARQAPRPCSRPARSRSPCAPPRAAVSRSRSFSFGMSTVLMPGAVRREHLLLDAADRQHVAAQRDLAGHRDVAAHRAPVSADASAVAIVTPADGPSFGIAPAGTWMWMSFFSKKSASMPSSFARVADVADAPPAPTPASRRRAGR